MNKNLLLGSGIVAAIVLGCYTGPELEATTTPAPPSQPTTNAPTGGAGLPCDVAQVLVTKCGDCHGEPPTRGARTTVTTRAALIAAWQGSPSVAHASVDRMRDTAAPMPPEGLLSAGEIEIIAKWVAAGMPEGSCSTGAPPPTQAPLKCTSGRFWTEGDDEGDKLMTPGQACITCHDKENAKHAGKKKDSNDDDDDDEELEAPAFSVAGTVYPTLREPDDCFGVGSLDAQVVVTGADGKTQTLEVNRAGNFMSEIAVAKPYTAKVVRGGKTRTMKTPQTNGDCNHCHSQEPKEAPGRILAP